MEAPGRRPAAAILPPRRGTVAGAAGRGGRARVQRGVRSCLPRGRRGQRHSGDEVGSPRACWGTRAEVPGSPGARSGTETEPAMCSVEAGPFPGGCPVP